jgi:hypothetical protein
MQCGVHLLLIAITITRTMPPINSGIMLPVPKDENGLTARLVLLPPGHDPNSYFAAGATAADFTHCLERAQHP